MSTQVKIVTKSSIESQGASGGQTDGMIRENAITGMSEKMCSSGLLSFASSLREDVLMRP